MEVTAQINCVSAGSTTSLLRTDSAWYRCMPVPDNNLVIVGSWHAIGSESPAEYSCSAWQEYSRQRHNACSSSYWQGHTPTFTDASLVYLLKNEFVELIDYILSLLIICHDLH